MSKQEEREAIKIIGVDHDITPIVSHLQRTINMMAAEMRNNRNDGWVQLHYRNTLKELRDYINKELEG